MADGQQNGFCSLAEVRAQLDGLSQADWLRARKLARRFCTRSGLWGPDELLAEAVARSLSEERHWRTSMEALPALMGIMRSIANSWRKSERRAGIDSNVEVGQLDAAQGDEDAARRVFATDSITPEQVVMGQELLAAVEAAVADDENASLVCVAWAEGLRGQEAIQQLGMDGKTYDAARKRLNRALDAVSDQG